MARTIIFGKCLYLKRRLTVGVFELLAFERNSLVGFQRGCVSGEGINLVVFIVHQGEPIRSGADTSHDGAVRMFLVVCHDRKHGDRSTSADEDPHYLAIAGADVSAAGLRSSGNGQNQAKNEHHKCAG